MNTATPAQCGLPKAHIEKMLHHFSRHGVNLHSVLMARGNHLFFEHYWQPYDENTPHRMYSVTKSFVSIAIGCLLDDGLLSLDDPIIRYFPDKLPPVIHPWLEKQTIRDMLMMCTCFADINWFQPEVTDRLAYYFSCTPVRPSGTIFHYDSTGSYVLGVLVERLSGMGLLDYLKYKCLNQIGGFENAEMLQTPDGTPWGDSALIATPRALMNFARLLMQDGQWKGAQLLNPSYIREATACQTDNSVEGRRHYNAHGYGYQFWRTECGGFSMHGMGGQYAICVPQKDFIFVCTGDNQLSGDQLQPVIFDTVFDEIVANLADVPCADEDPLSLEPSVICVARGEPHSAFASAVNGCWYACDPNPMGISRFKLDFQEESGLFSYSNAQGDKTLPFGMKHHIIGPFPQAGYSNQRGNVHEISDFRYRCAASGGWIESRKLQLRIQIIDRYLGQLFITFGFRDQNTAGVRMVKSAEDFLKEYEGWMGARRMP